MIDLRRLEVLQAVSRDGGVSGAARALHLTPSAVSQRIRQLSRELGVELLSPDGRGVRLTAQARVLLRHADALGAGWERAKADLAAQAQGEAGELRLIGYPTAIATLLAPAAAQLHAARPRLRVFVDEVDGLPAYQAVLAGDADLAIAVPAPGGPTEDDQSFTRVPLLKEPQDLFVPAGHPLAERGPVELADAAGADWIRSNRDCHQAHIIDTACAAAGFTPRIAQQAADYIGVCSLIAHGLGITLGPRLLTLPADGSIARVPLTGDVVPMRSVLAVVRRGSELRPDLAAVLRLLSEISDRTPVSGLPGGAAAGVE
ncbi:LysR family transcriptional regulator [Nocardiopsis coralliicola]